MLADDFLEKKFRTSYKKGDNIRTCRALEPSILELLKLERV